MPASRVLHRLRLTGQVIPAPAHSRVLPKGRPIKSVIDSEKVVRAIEQVAQELWTPYFNDDPIAKGGNFAKTLKFNLGDLFVAGAQPPPEGTTATVSVMLTLKPANYTKLKEFIPQAVFENLRVSQSKHMPVYGHLLVPENPESIGPTLKMRESIQLMPSLQFLLDKLNEFAAKFSSNFDDVRSLYEVEFKWSQMRALRDRTGPLADSAEMELHRLEEKLHTLLNSEAYYLYAALRTWLTGYDWIYTTDAATSPVQLMFILAQRLAGVRAPKEFTKILSSLGLNSDEATYVKSSVDHVHNGEPEGLHLNSREVAAMPNIMRLAKNTQLLVDLGVVTSVQLAAGVRAWQEDSHMKTWRQAAEMSEKIKPEVFQKLGVREKIIRYHTALTTAHNNGMLSEYAFSSNFEYNNLRAPEVLTNLSNMAPPPEWQSRVDKFTGMPRGGARVLTRVAITAPLEGSDADVARIEPIPEPKPEAIVDGKVVEEERRIPVAPKGGVANIVNTVRSMRGPELEYWAKWYSFAQSVAKELALAYKLPLEVVAGVIAVLSPGSKWHGNIQAAKAVLAWWDQRERQGPWADKSLSGVGRFRFGQRGRPTTYVWDDLKVRKDAPKKTKDPADFRAPLKNPMSHNLPLGAYGPSVPSYGENIRKAVGILDAWVAGDTNPGPKFINQKSSPKVWAFFNSIVDPGFAENELVLDGHAINIWRGKKVPLKGISQPSESERTQMLADYATAAKILGIPVQAVQAATWWAWKYGTPITEA